MSPATTCLLGNERRGEREYSNGPRRPSPTRPTSPGRGPGRPRPAGWRRSLQRIDPGWIGAGPLRRWRWSSTSAPTRRGPTSTTTSCGRRTPSCTAAPGSPTRSPRGHSRTTTSRTSCRSPGRAARRSPSRRCRPSCCCRSWRSSAWPPTPPLVAAVLGAVNVGLCWAHAPGASRPRRSAALLGTRLLRLRHGGLVRGHAGHDLVPGPRRGLDVPLPGHPAGRAAPTGADLPARLRRERSGRWSTAGRGRPALRHGGAGAPDDDLRGALLRLRGRRRSLAATRPSAAGIGAAIPVAAPAGLQRGHHGPRLPPGLRVPLPRRVPARGPELSQRPDWGIEDLRYIPQNAGIMLAWPPERPLLDDPACADRPFDLAACSTGLPARCGPIRWA